MLLYYIHHKMYAKKKKRKNLQEELPLLKMQWHYLRKLLINAHL